MTGVRVTIGGRTWLVPRFWVHYRVTGADLAEDFQLLGFPEITPWWARVLRVLRGQASW